MLYTNTVEPNTLVLLKSLQKIKEFSKLRLVGGTALALQIGHRKSIDLDFFGEIELTGNEIISVLYEHNFTELVIENERKNIHQFRINDIKVDFVNYSFKWLSEALFVDEIFMALQEDIAAMKLEAITNRGSKKNFIDIFFLLKNFSLTQMLDFYKNKFPFGSIFNVVRSLSYFEDAEIQVTPNLIQPLDWNVIKQTIKQAVIKL